MVIRWLFTLKLWLSMNLNHQEGHMLFACIENANTEN